MIKTKYSKNIIHTPTSALMIIGCALSDVSHILYIIDMHIKRLNRVFWSTPHHMRSSTPFCCDLIFNTPSSLRVWWYVQEILSEQ
jgi:hypothetical protein